MRGLNKLPKEARAQIGFGAFLILLSLVWLSAILYVVAPDQIRPSHEDVQAAFEAFINIVGVPASQWSFNTVGLAIMQGAVLIFLDILFVVARYGGLTLLFLGGFAVFEAISKLRSAGR